MTMEDLPKEHLARKLLESLETKTLRELAREEGILTEKWFAHQVPDKEYDEKQDGKWGSVETVTALLTKLFQEQKQTKVTCDKIDCKYHPAHKKDTIFAGNGVCEASEIQIEDQGNCFSCNSYEESI